MSPYTLIYSTFGYNVYFTTPEENEVNAAANSQDLFENALAELERIKRQLLSVPDGLEALMMSLCDFLPHGSGIDYDWDITIARSPIPNPRGTRGRKREIGYLVTCENDYHGMDHAGGYNGTIGGFTLSFWLDGELTPVSRLSPASMRDGRIDNNAFIICTLKFKESIRKLVRENAIEYEHSDEDDEFYGVDWQGIVEYLDDTLPSSLQDWFKHLAGQGENSND